MKYDSTKATRLAAEGSGIDSAIVVMSTRARGSVRRLSQCASRSIVIGQLGTGSRAEECLFLAHPSVPGPNGNARFADFRPSGGRPSPTTPSVRLHPLDQPTEGIPPSIIKDIGRALVHLRQKGGMAILGGRAIFRMGARHRRRLCGTDHGASVARRDERDRGAGPDDGLKHTAAPARLKPTKEELAKAIGQYLFWPVFRPSR